MRKIKFKPRDFSHKITHQHFKSIKFMKGEQKTEELSQSGKAREKKTKLNVRW